MSTLRCRIRAAGAVVTTVIMVTAQTVMAQDVFVANPGENITLWSGWNIRSKIYLKIESEADPSCMHVWWNRMGIVTESWEVCDRAEVSACLPLIFGKLRAGHFQSKTAIALSTEDSVAYSHELCEVVIDC